MGRPYSEGYKKAHEIVEGNEIVCAGGWTRVKLVQVSDPVIKLTCVSRFSLTTHIFRKDETVKVRELY